MKNETTENELLSTLVERLQARLGDTICDAIAEELETLFYENDIADEDGELMYELFGRVYLGHN
jgi:hypothetical protein